MISRSLLIVLLLLAITFFALLTRWIVKLPQKYERTPRALNSWSALDVGIDPSENDSSRSDAGSS